MKNRQIIDDGFCFSRHFKKDPGTGLVFQSAVSVKTILLIDDRDWDRKLLALALTSLGYKVVQAHNEKEELEIIQLYAWEIDLILVHAFSPEVDGVDWLEKAFLLNPELKTLFISTHRWKPIWFDKQKMDFIQPSTNIVCLVKKIRKMLGQKELAVKWTERILLKGQSAE